MIEERKEKMSDGELAELIATVNNMSLDAVIDALEKEGATPGAVQRMNAADYGEEVRFDIIYITLLQKKYYELISEYIEKMLDPYINWDIGKTISADGTMSDNEHFAITDIIACSKGDRIYVDTPPKDNQNRPFSMYLVAYKTINSPNDTFYYRYGLGSERNFVFENKSGGGEGAERDDITGFRFLFGRGSGVTNRTPFSVGDLDYWKAKYYLKACKTATKLVTDYLQKASIRVDGGSTYEEGLLSDLEPNTFVRCKGTKTAIGDKPDFIGDSTGFWVLTTQSNNAYAQFCFDASKGRLATRYAGSDRSYFDWNTFNETPIIIDNTGNYGGDLNNLKENTLRRCTNNAHRPSGSGSGTGLWVLTTKAGNTSYAQFAFLATTGDLFSRYGTGTNPGAGGVTYQDWVSQTAAKSSEDEKEIKILCIGNSFAQDNVAYAPFILSNICPNIKLTLGISYYGGASIDNYVDFFDNDTASIQYDKSVNAQPWTIVSGKTIKQIIADENWDIITFQQKSDLQDDLSSYENLNSLINKVLTYSESLNHKSPRLAWLMPQIRCNDMSTNPDAYNERFDNVVACMRNVLDKTPINFFIPCGTAVQNARGTTLNSLGEFGALSFDGYHLQEGLPCMIGAYVMAITIAKIKGVDYLGIWGEKTRPDLPWVEAKNIPGQNPSSQDRSDDPSIIAVIGVNDDNVWLAKKCASAAIEKPYELTIIPQEAEFNAYKANKKIAVQGLAEDGDSEAVAQIISNALAAIDALLYDKTKTFTENKANIDALADIADALDDQRATDEA